MMVINYFQKKFQMKKINNLKIADELSEEILNVGQKKINKIR